MSIKMQYHIWLQAYSLLKAAYLYKCVYVYTRLNIEINTMHTDT